MSCNRTCDRCDCDVNLTGLRRVVCLDSRRPVTRLCLICWSDLQVWMRPTPAALRRALLAEVGVTPHDERPS